MFSNPTTTLSAQERRSRPTTHTPPQHTQRLAAFDAAVRVVDASPAAWAPPLAANFHRALRRALCLGAPAPSAAAGSDVTSAASAPSPSKAAAAAALADTASSRPAGSPLRRPSVAAATATSSPPRRAPSWRLGSAVKALSLRRASSPAADSASTIPARPPPRPPPCPPNPAAAAAAAAALAAAAPATRGDVAPAEWTGLLVGLTAAAGPGADPTPPVAYLARACKRMFGGDAATALDVATEALAPALALLRRGGASMLPPPGLERALATAAPAAVAAAETAVRDRHAPGLGWRARRGATAAALRLLSVVLATDGVGVACVAAGLAADGADARYSSLAAAAGGGAAGLAAVADAAAVDVAADTETLAAATRGDDDDSTPPAAASLALAREAARVYCVRLKADIGALLSSAPRRAVDGGFIKLVVATHALASASTPHAPSAARSLAGGDAPPFAPAVCAWLDGAASKLARWPARALAADGDAGLPPVGASAADDDDDARPPPPRCRASLVDLCAALLALADDCAPLAAAHPLYAASLERALAAAVSALAAALDAAATTALAPPRRTAGRAAAAARLGAAARAAAAGLPAGTPPRGCLAALSDLRELRPRVDGLAATLRAALPPGWWGGRSGPGLGAALRVARADAARRYEAAVAAAAAAAAVPLRAPLSRAADAAATAAAAPPADRAAAASTAADAADALTTSLADTLTAVAAGADARVARALARGVWSELAAAATAPLGGGSAVGDTTGLAHRAAGAASVLACVDGAVRRAGGLSGEGAPPRVARAVADVDRFLRD